MSPSNSSSPSSGNSAEEEVKGAQETEGKRTLRRQGPLSHGPLICACRILEQINSQRLGQHAQGLTDLVFMQYDFQFSVFLRFLSIQTVGLCVCIYFLRIIFSSFTSVFFLYSMLVLILSYISLYFIIIHQNPVCFLMKGKERLYIQMKEEGGRNREVQRKRNP